MEKKSFNNSWFPLVYDLFKNFDWKSDFEFSRQYVLEML